MLKSFKPGHIYRSINNVYVVKLIAITHHGHINECIVDVIDKETSQYRRAAPFFMNLDNWEEDGVVIKDIWLELENKLLECKL